VEALVAIKIIDTPFASPAITTAGLGQDLPITHASLSWLRVQAALACQRQAHTSGTTTLADPISPALQIPVTSSSSTHWTNARTCSRTHPSRVSQVGVDCLVGDAVGFLMAVPPFCSRAAARWGWITRKDTPLSSNFHTFWLYLRFSSADSLHSKFGLRPDL